MESAIECSWWLDLFQYAIQGTTLALVLALALKLSGRGND